MLRRGFASGGNRRHGDVGEDVTLNAQGTTGPRDLNQPVISLISSQFTSPILFQHHTADHHQSGSDGACAKFSINGGKEEPTVVEANEFDRYFAGCQINADTRAFSKICNGDVEQEFVVFEFNTRTAQDRPIGDRTHLIVHVFELGIGVAGRGT